MKLYCERALYDFQTKAYEVVFDFMVMSDLDVLARLADIDNTNIDNTNIGGISNTLLILRNVKVESYKGPRSGFWYDIPNELFENFHFENAEPEFRLIKYILTMRTDRKLNFQQFKVKNRNRNLYLNHEEPVYFKESHLYKYLNEIENTQNLRLIVRNVGCGNWNEIKGNKLHIIYDLGGDVKYSDSEMNHIISRVKLTKPYFAVISHWDLDHYRAILDLDDVQLRLMQNIIVPSKMPNTLQLKNALHRLQSLGIKIDIIRPSVRRGNIKLVSQGRIKSFELFRSSDGANLNQSGIVLTIEGDRKIGVLTGDHHYPQIYNGVLNANSVKPYEIVVPHHGGNAGTFDESLWNTLPLASGALSTKSFRYKNLPQRKIHDFFITQQSFYCTECQSADYSTTL